MADKTVRLVIDAETGGKFYVYTSKPEFVHNEGGVEIPKEMALAVAYPTLEDYLVQPITRIEGAMITIESYPDDKTIIEEFEEEIKEGRRTIGKCLNKVIGKIEQERLILLGCMFDLFKDRLVDLSENGSLGYVDLNGIQTEEAVRQRFGNLYIRNSRKHNKIPLEQKGLWRYHFRKKESLRTVEEVEGAWLMYEVFKDLKDANEDERTYGGMDCFKNCLSDKWLGLLRLYRECVVGAMQGTNEADYDLSQRLWQETPLCKSITSIFQRLEESGKYKFE